MSEGEKYKAGTGELWVEFCVLLGGRLLQQPLLFILFFSSYFCCTYIYLSIYSNIQIYRLKVQ